MAGINKTYLTFKQKWAVASWCIENRNVIADYIVNEDKTAYILWRVGLVQTAKELNKAKLDGIPELTGSQIRICVDFFNEISDIIKKYPEPRAVVDTVEMDQLTAKYRGLENVVHTLEQHIVKKDDEIKDLKNKLRQFEIAMKAIFKLIPAYILSLKI